MHFLNRVDSGFFEVGSEFTLELLADSRVDTRVFMELIIDFFLS